MKIRQTLLTAALLLVIQSGCGQSDADTTDADHHLEHFVPHHKPANYSEAVKGISDRAQHLSQHAGHGHSDESEEFQELVEIVDWIPELAADSDLGQSEWNEAADAASKLARQLAARRSPEGTLNMAELSKLIADEFKVLEGLVVAAGKPEPRISHGHDHHDHDHDHDHHDHDPGDHDPGDHDESEHHDEDE